MYKTPVTNSILPKVIVMLLAQVLLSIKVCDWMKVICFDFTTFGYLPKRCREFTNNK